MAALLFHSFEPRINKDEKKREESGSYVEPEYIHPGVEPDLFMGFNEFQGSLRVQYRQIYAFIAKFLE